MIEQDVAAAYEALGMLAAEAEQTSVAAQERQAALLSKYMIGRSDAYADSRKLLRYVLDKAGVEIAQEGKGGKADAKAR